MRSFAQKPKVAQQTASVKSTVTGRTHFGQSREVNSLLHLRRTVGDQAALRALPTNAEELKAGLTDTTLPHFGHDLSRIPMHPPMVGTIQMKLAITKPEDEFEQEADRVAGQVMRLPEPQLQRACACGGRCPKCQTEQAGQEHENLQAKRVGSSNLGQAAVPPIIHEVLSSPGQPLDPAVRAFMEQRFGRDFSRVRVHAGAVAERSVRDVNAHAYTVGHDVVFGAGRFAPGTYEGRRLLAHELTHVVQQSGASQPRLQRSVLVPADPNCPDYEPGERSASHREPGYLGSDVERLAPDKLLVADFGVDWRHVKASTKSDPTLQAWLTAWESDTSYRLGIVGYSDCVGDEGLNTDLRQARASNVEALLGPSAKSRVTFRGMAALGNYVTDNSSPDNRARNRGVVIEFHQEFEFPEEEITVTPQHCGPDSTQWLVDQMNRNRNHPVIKTQREVQWPNWIPFFNLGWNYGALSDFRDLVKAGAPWDFKSNQTQWRSGAGKTCPTAQCDKTVFLCGKCFFYDVPGNIHYGYIGRMASIRAWFLHDRASAAQVGGQDPADDAAAIDIGIAMADQGATLCGEIAAHEDELNRDGTEGCGLCPRTS